MKSLDELANEYVDKELAEYPSQKHVASQHYKAGFIAAQTEMEKREAVLVEALESLRSLVDDDNVKTTTEDDEEEYWINDQQVQFICDQALAQLEKVES